MSCFISTSSRERRYAALAPLLVGWIRKVKARLQNRQGAPVLQPCRDLYKLLAKEARVAHTASLAISGRALYRARRHLAGGRDRPSGGGRLADRGA